MSFDDLKEGMLLYHISGIKGNIEKIKLIEPNDRSSGLIQIKFQERLPKTNIKRAIFRISNIGKYLFFSLNEKDIHGKVENFKQEDSDSCKITTQNYQQTIVYKNNQFQDNCDFISILSDISQNGWNMIIQNEPEWYNMESFLSKYGFGKFSVLMIATALNDFQLTGKAEEVYWPRIKQLLASQAVPASLSDLYNYLEPFFLNERLSRLKLNRLKKFLESKLAQTIFSGSTNMIEDSYQKILSELATTMGQNLFDKTIVFAMKCLGICLIMAGKWRFDCKNISIPVDYRIISFSNRIGIGEEHDIIRASWGRILESLQEKNSGITIIHLDSLIWQIAMKTPVEIRKYFDDIYLSSIGERMHEFIERLSEKQDKKYVQLQNSSLKSIINEDSSQRMICFMPCCSKKKPSGKIVTPIQQITDIDVPNTWQNLISGRNGMDYCINKTTEKTSALYMYIGSPYETFVDYIEKIINLIHKGHLLLYIISAGYGIIDALEPIYNYNEMLKGKVAQHWKNNGLDKIIADILIVKKPSSVIGFFTGMETWYPSASTYRFFYSEGVKTALRNGLKANVGCLYRREGFGAKAILNALGHAFVELLENDLSFEKTSNLYEDGKIENGVNICFENLLSSPH